MELDPIQYEIFRHRLFNILEEGRIAIKMVSGSPVVVEGGETMCSFYTSDGTPILTAAGVTLHCLGARDFILRAIEWYEDDPGIFDGDQFFFNDPYIGGAHLPDMIVIKPIFYQGKRIAWTGSIMHTSETGGVEPGGMMSSSREIFHEGIRIQGLKIVEKGRFRPDVFRTIVEQVRDPHLVGLDAKAKIAANNVCARSYLKLVEKYGIEFVEMAKNRIIADSERMARARLRNLPDGVWRARMYADSTGMEDKAFKVICTMTKEGDEITFDFTGSSPQVEGSVNNTLTGSWGCLFIVLAGQLFWNVSWNGGMFAPVKLTVPEGTVVNCRFPAACSNGVIGGGMMLESTAHECVAKMLYAGALYEDVNSAWCGLSGGAPTFGGLNQYGARVGGQILDTFAVGDGAAPYRDGVDTGGQLRNPQSNVADVEMIELNIPFMYLTRRQATDSGGFGKNAGGMSPEAIYMIYGTNTLNIGFRGVGSMTPGGWGMFGGYPTALQGGRLALDSNVGEWFARSKYPKSVEEVGLLKGRIIDPSASFVPIPVKHYDMLLRRMCAGGGYGDPLDRSPEVVWEDVSEQAVSPYNAERVYGLVLERESWRVNLAATKERRGQLRKDRLREGRKIN